MNETRSKITCFSFHIIVRRNAYVSVDVDLYFCWNLFFFFDFQKINLSKIYQDGFVVHSALSGLSLSCTLVLLSSSRSCTSVILSWVAARSRYNRGRFYSLSSVGEWAAGKPGVSTSDGHPTTFSRQNQADVFAPKLRGRSAVFVFFFL